jgi:hypothetical protein
MNIKLHWKTVSVELLIALVLVFAFTTTAFAAAELPTFSMSNFSNPTKITNSWFSLPVGREFEYEGETDEGMETIEIEINGGTKKVHGIETLVYRDIVWVDGEVVEDTRDYLAQDNSGNVWYLGEDVDNYEDGKIVDHDGSWLAGVDGAKPGYWMKANPKVGDFYKQEFYAGEAEDEAKVLSVTEKVKTKLATYNNCLKIQDIVPGDPVVEYKYYCKQVGGLVLEEKPIEKERIELVDYETEDGTDADEDEEEDELAFEADDDDEDQEGKDESEDKGNESQDIRALQVRLIALIQQLIALLQGR